MAKLDEILDFADIGEFIDQPAKTYSSGMMVRLAFAVQTTIIPDILIVDEALSVGDEAFQRKCFARIENLRERGTTILLVSHSSAQVVELCDRAFLLHGGELILDEAPVTVAKQYHRLIYSPPERQATVLERIRAGDLVDEESGRDDGNVSSGETDGEPDAPIREEGDESFMDPSLRSQSKVEYSCEGIRLTDPSIFNGSGEAVNVLSSGCEYRFRYTAFVEKDSFHVVFGTLLRSTSGLDLSGFRTAADDPLCEHLRPGDQVMIEFAFRCSLPEGTYFLNVGAEGGDGERRKFLHRVVDSCCFRVLPGKDSRHAGLVHLFERVSARVEQ